MKHLKRLFVITLSLLFLSPVAQVKAADYKVVKNDTLYNLSILFDTKIEDLRASNNLDGDNLFPNQVIFVPAHIHKVKKDESLSSIAKKYRIPLTNLRKANKKSTNTIKIGERLMIPGVKPYRIADSVIPYSKGEVELLAKLIEAEAGGESFQAKIAVGAVVVNRVQSGEWAPTIKGVIYQRFGEYYQFTPVKNGYINNTPSKESRRAAWFAMFGSDPSDGAIFFFDHTSTNEWLWAKPKTAFHDSFIFAK